jgi:hypothetical protein
MAPTNEEKGFIPWNKACEARAIMLRDLQNGDLELTEEEMAAEDAWKFKYSSMAPFRHVPFDQFAKQLEAHRAQVAKENEKLSAAWKAFEHDQALFSRRTHDRRGKLVFDMHPAKLKLREDVKNKVHKSLSPSELLLTRPEYQCFTLDEFRERVYQEIRLQRFYNYLDMDRTKKEADQKKLWAKERQKLDKKAKRKAEDKSKLEKEIKAKLEREAQMDCS